MSHGATEHGYSVAACIHHKDTDCLAYTLSSDIVAYLVVHHRHSITGMLISSGIQSKQKSEKDTV